MACCGRWAGARPRAAGHVGVAPVKEQVIHFVNKKLPGGLPKRTARALLDIEDRAYVPIIRDPRHHVAETEAVFYFPAAAASACSARGLATQAMLWHAGVQTVPPGYLCCGYPRRGSGQFDKAEKIITDNRVLFPPRGQHAELPGHQDRGRGELRHLLRPAAGLQVRGDLPRLPHRRHPRVPAGKGIVPEAPPAAPTLPRPCHSPMKLQDR